MVPLIIVLVIAVVLIGFGIGIYNSLVTAGVKVNEAWSDITVQLKRRYDLIPNLVNTVKGYAQHEKDTFENVTKARSEAMQANGVADTAAAENHIQAALKSLFAVAENYPDLKANQNFMDLQAQLVDTENKIQSSRRYYNGTVRDLNTKLQVFPTNIFAKLFGFKSREFFELPEDEQAAAEKPVDVKF
ncbi:hypothetical protein CR970_02360 [Candidatus Saccharibacteria bacterium]|nr:MAG: hypothetical protein CR970_02360 [Candidatus Saccharibacteria bacterium]